MMKNDKQNSNELISENNKMKKHDIQSDKNIWDYVSISTLTIGFAFLYIRKIGLYGLWDPWEPQYALAFRKMIENGGYITLPFDEFFRWTDWIIFLSLKILGITEF